ncbi:MAG: helix-turn-helix domain-containing protein [Bacteroidota bacterium]
MAIHFITREDLNEFRSLLLADLTALLSPNPQHQKQWLNTTELRQIINISPHILKTLRTSRALTTTKIGNTIYYATDDLNQLIQSKKVDSTVTLFNPQWLIR